VSFAQTYAAVMGLMVGDSIVIPLHRSDGLRPDPATGKTPMDQLADAVRLSKYQFERIDHVDRREFLYKRTQ